MNLRAVVKGAASETLILCFLSNDFHSQNAEVCTTILTQMLLSLFPTSKAKVSGIGIANKIETKQYGTTYNAPEYKQQQKIQKDLGGSAVRKVPQWGMGWSPSRDRIW